jgi:flagellar assembly factor FliW
LRETVFFLRRGLCESATGLHHNEYMPSFPTTYFGELEYDPSSVFDFPSGIPGFEEHTHFLLVEQPQSHPVVFVQSLRSPDLCFIALPVLVVDYQYRLELTEEDLAAVELANTGQPRIGAEVACLALVTVTENADPTANLRSPLVLNLAKRIGRQVIHQDATYSFRQPIPATEEAARCSC